MTNPTQPQQPPNQAGWTPVSGSHPDSPKDWIPTQIYPRPDPNMPDPRQHIHEAPKKSKRFGWPTVLIVAVGSWFIGLLFGIVGGTNTPTTTVTAAPAETVTATATQTATEYVTEKPKASAPAPKPQIDTTIDNGTHEVGVDVQAGQYKTMVPDGDLCYWARSKDDSGDSIIVNELVNGPARQSVTIKRGEFFESNDCGTWRRVG